MKPLTRNVIDDLRTALEQPGAINAGLAAHVRTLLQHAHEPEQKPVPVRESTFDGRRVGVDGIPELGTVPAHPAV